MNKSYRVLKLYTYDCHTLGLLENGDYAGIMSIDPIQMISSNPGEPLDWWAVDIEVAKLIVQNKIEPIKIWNGTIREHAGCIIKRLTCG